MKLSNMKRFSTTHAFLLCNLVLISSFIQYSLASYNPNNNTNNYALEMGEHMEKKGSTWQNLQGSWGKRNYIPIDDYYINGNQLYSISDDTEYDEDSVNNLKYNLNPYRNTVQEPGNFNVQQKQQTQLQQKRAWKSMNGAWGKRVGSSGWNKFRGTWGKREPAWNNLKGLWGKRSQNWNKLQSAWGKRDLMGSPQSLSSSPSSGLF